MTVLRGLSMGFVKKIQNEAKSLGTAESAKKEDGAAVADAMAREKDKKTED